MGRNGANPKGGWSDGDLTDTGRWAKAYFLGEYARSLARRSVNETLSAGSCDCSWTSTCGPQGCGDCKDDGSQCFHECCGSPGPAPTPVPPPLPAATYCPDPATDFQIEVEPGAQGMVDWSDSGWTIHGQRRVSSKASYNLAGGYIEWDMDLSGAHGNVNNNFYLTYPTRPNCGIDCYCDSGGCPPGCAEMDLTENNGNCWQATTWHPDPNGGDHGGEAQEGGLSAH